jgi:hypothetical protein
MRAMMRMALWVHWAILQRKRCSLHGVEVAGLSGALAHSGEERPVEEEDVEREDPADKSLERAFSMSLGE